MIKLKFQGLFWFLSCYKHAIVWKFDLFKQERKFKINRKKINEKNCGALEY